MALRVAYKVVNAAGTQQYNGATGASTDWAAVAGMFTEPVVTPASWIVKGRIAWTPV
jgi:hypothetical protein